MAESRKLFTIKSDENGEIKTSEEVVAIIAALAATEVDGVESLGGNITNEMVAKIGLKSLAKGLTIEIFEGEVKVDVTVNLGEGYNIPDVCSKVQERIKSTVETMSGLAVAMVNVDVASVDMGE